MGERVGVAVAAMMLVLFASACSVHSSSSSTSTGTTASASVGSAGSAPVTANQAIRASTDTPDGSRADADTLLLELRSIDTSIAVDMRYRGTDNFTGAPLPGYEANRAFLHRDAARAFARVQRALRADGLGLKVFDAYRPVRATLAMVEWTRRVGRESLVRDGYISDRSRHNLGVAVDATLVDLRTGAELEMGTPYDTFSAAAHTANATGVPATNRARFVAAMAREGFENYDQEWWHFSYTVARPMRFDVAITDRSPGR